MGKKKHQRSRLLLLLLVPVLPALFFGANWVWHAMEKPSEVVGLVENGYFKNPRSTWEAFGPLFVRYATSIITPELLAALAQAETRGNPIARTYWRWRWSWNPFHIYSPASSAVGLFQITDGTFVQAKKYCIHDGKVATEGKWYDADSCWFNPYYNRLVPSHAVEMTSAYLHVTVEKMTGYRPLSRGTLQDLAALTHLCGPGVASSYLKRGFRFSHEEHCEAHDPRVYLAHVRQLREVFRKLAAAK